jgi:hypothetical protein
MEQQPHLSTVKLFKAAMEEHAAAGCGLIPGVTPEHLARGLPNDPHTCKDVIVERIVNVEVYCPRERVDQRPYGAIIRQIEKNGWAPSREDVSATPVSVSFPTLKAA